MIKVEQLKEQVKDQIAIMQAWLDGEEIEIFDPIVEKWTTISNPSFTFYNHVYRVKPKPVYERVSSIHEATHAKSKWWPDLYKIASYTVENGKLAVVGLPFVNSKGLDDVSNYTVFTDWEFYKEVK